MKINPHQLEEAAVWAISSSVRSVWCRMTCGDKPAFLPALCTNGLLFQPRNRWPWRRQQIDGRGTCETKRGGVKV
jgi:hypothetical protein